MPFPSAFSTKAAVLVRQPRASATIQQFNRPPRGTATGTMLGRHLAADRSTSHSTAGDPTVEILRNALSERRFQLYYQPIVSASSQQAIAYEALVRLCTADRGIVAPAEFIPSAERSGFITELSAWILAEACREMAYRSKSLGVFVNISAVSLANADVVSIVSAALASSGLQPNRLTIEITESVYLNVTNYVSLQVDTLTKMGVRIAIDDFGTGYCSLSCLDAIPFNCIKVDRSFVKQITLGAKSRVVVQAILDMAVGLGVQTIVEGIETEDQARVMAEMGVGALQGYYFGHPMPAESAFTEYSNNGAQTLLRQS